MARITHSSRLKTGQELALLLASFAHRLGVGVERQLFGLEGDGAGEAPLERLVFGARERLLAARQRLMERDGAVQRRTEEGREARQLRDEAAGEVRGHLVQLRNLVIGAWGRREVPRVLLLGRRTSEDPVVLLRQARQVQARLLQQGQAQGQAPVAEGRPQLIPVEVDFSFLAARVGEAAEVLEARLAEALSVRREEEAAVVARREAARDFDQVYRSSREWLLSLWSLAGMVELAPLTNVDRRRRRPKAPQIVEEAMPAEPAAVPRRQAPSPAATGSVPGAERRPPAPPVALRFPRSWLGALALPP